MKKIVLSMFLALSFLSGCASVDMAPAPLVTAAKENKVLVTFVRQSILLGDGQGVDIWHGENFVGSLAAGAMIQYEVDPGKHLFLASSENWSYASGDFEAGKQYIIKANIFPGFGKGRVALGALKHADSREERLMSLKPTVATQSARAARSDKRRRAVTKAIANFNDGKVTVYANVTPAHAR